jgi:hypothetical protein
VAGVLDASALRPSAFGPAQVPFTPLFRLIFPTQASRLPSNLEIATLLTQTRASQTELEIGTAGFFGAKETTLTWILEIDGFTGYFCKPDGYHTEYFRATHSYLIRNTSRIVPKYGGHFLTMELCWHSNSPLQVNGPYFSADLSPVNVDGISKWTLMRALRLSGNSLAAYSPTLGVTPTETSPTIWFWNSTLSGVSQTNASNPIPVVGASLPGIQHDTSNIFYSGILFGIAGGAAVTVVPVMLDAIDRRKAYCKNSSATGSSSETTDAGTQGG